MKKSLEDTVDELILSNQQEKAIEILLAEYESARSSGNRLELDSVFGHLVFAYGSSDPPNILLAHRFCLEREQNMSTAYNMLQTGMFLYYTADNYGEAVNKLREAITAGRREEDTRTVYSCLGVLGLALLRQGHHNETSEVLREIEQAIADKKPCVIGDETSFLEAARKAGFELDRVKKIAAILAPLCREPQFAQRLSVLAKA